MRRLGLGICIALLFCTADARDRYSIFRPTDTLQAYVVADSTSNAAFAQRIVTAYNERSIGSPGWRRVSLELFTGRRLTRKFTILNLWQRTGASVRTLFFLEQPKELQSTSYMLWEHPRRSKDMAVHLYLPAGERRVLKVKPTQFDRGLLGSDFGYSDVRMLSHQEGYLHRLVGDTTMAGRRAWIVEMRPQTAEKTRTVPWFVARFFFARDFAFLLGADYYRNGRPYKQMRVESLEKISGVWTATRIRMTTSEGHTSLLTLEKAAFHIQNIEARWFNPEALPRLDRLLSDFVRF